MTDRWRTPDGWSVEAVRLSLTPDNHDGEWLRVRYFGLWVADVRQVAELAAWFPLGELREALGSPASSARPTSGLLPDRRPPGRHLGPS